MRKYAKISSYSKYYNTIQKADVRHRFEIFQQIGNFEKHQNNYIKHLTLLTYGLIIQSLRGVNNHNVAVSRCRMPVAVRRELDFVAVIFFQNFDEHSVATESEKIGRFITNRTYPRWFPVEKKGVF